MGMWGIRLVWMEEEQRRNRRNLEEREEREDTRLSRSHRTEREGEGDKVTERVNMRGFVYVDGSLLFLWLGLTAGDQPRLLIWTSGQQ